MARQAAVAGQFYPLDRKRLADEVDAFLACGALKKEAMGVLSPHAGYVFSGAVAGRVFAEVAIPRQVVILGPNHHGLGHTGAVYAHGSWATPLGETRIDQALAEQILQTCPHLGDDALAHRHEHSLEVQLPFLQRLRPDVEIVPICLGHLRLEDLLEVGAGLAGVLGQFEPRPLLVASSDMSHYEPGSLARQKDHHAIEQILALDPEGLYRTVRDERISMCGVLPGVAMIAAARHLGATGAELIAYANSGDITGDQSEVVGYAGLVIR